MKFDLKILNLLTDKGIHEAEPVDNMTGREVLNFIHDTLIPDLETQAAHSDSGVSVKTSKSTKVQ